MFSGLSEVMKVLSGGPGAVKNVLKNVGPEAAKSLHDFFADKVDLGEGESGYIVGLAQHNGLTIVMAMVIHDTTGVCRIASKFTIEAAIDSIPEEKLKFSKMLGK